jgi:hypothetical protein
VVAGLLLVRRPSCAVVSDDPLPLVACRLSEVLSSGVSASSLDATTKSTSKRDKLRISCHFRDVGEKLRSKLCGPEFWCFVEFDPEF